MNATTGHAFPRMLFLRVIGAMLPLAAEAHAQPRWETMPSMPLAVLHARVTVSPDQQRIVVTGGRSATGPAAVEQTFDLATQTWSIRALAQTPPLDKGEFAAVTMPDGRRVEIGGRRNDMIRVDGQALPVRMPFPIDDLAAAALDADRVWIIGGQDSRSGDTTDRTWILNLATRTLADGPRLGLDGGVADHVVVDLGDRVVVAGGESQRDGRDTELAAAWLLDKATLTVSRLPDMSIAHDDAAAAMVNGQVWIFGGFAPVETGGEPLAVPINVVERLWLESP